MPKIYLSMLFVLLMGSALIAAETKFGVAVYPGAKYDAVRTKLSKFTKNGGEAAYRTNDGIADVAAFYKKQSLIVLRIGGESKERIRLKDVKNNVDVIVQNPWKDPETKAVMHDTLILILKEGE